MKQCFITSGGCSLSRNHYERIPHRYLVLHDQGRCRCLQKKTLALKIHRITKVSRRQIVVECAAVRVVQWHTESARDSDPGFGTPLTLDIRVAGYDPRYGPRRSRHARSRYHGCRHGISLDALSRRDRRVLHDLLLRYRRWTKPPIGAHVTPFLRQKQLRCGSARSNKAATI